MYELKLGRMEKISRQRDGGTGFRTDFSWSSIQSVPDDRVPQGPEVYANLVSASGFDLNFEQRELAERRIDSVLHFVMRDCLTSAGPARSHARAADRIA